MSPTVTFTTTADFNGGTFSSTTDGAVADQVRLVAASDNGLGVILTRGPVVTVGGVTFGTQLIVSPTLSQIGATLAEDLKA